MNVADLFARAALYCPDKKGLIFGQRSFTYFEMNRIIDALARYLAGSGVSEGDRVSIYMANRPEWILFYYAVAKIGAISVCVPGAYKRNEMKGVVNDSRSSVLVCSEQLLSQIPAPKEMSGIRKRIVVERDEILQAAMAGKDTPGILPKIKTSGDDPAAILYTGGTTGIPKGAMLTHRNLLYSAQNVICHERLVQEDIGINFLPLNHVFAQCHIMHTYFSACATLVLFPGFDMDKVVSAVIE
ncbi:MAG: acyl-CoA synthetase (AMP-forming)/AMP-acid ligase, partial [Acidobacteria bacterium]|nr:acyl-CoA synthetase (AMP-forming)/AMP-acid ligase [Acidobacteriota bacterium]